MAVQRLTNKPYDIPVRGLNRRRFLFTLMALPALVSACGESTPEVAPTPIASTPNPQAQGPNIRVGSKNFTEQYIVAEMYALLLEQAGFRVERKLNLGATDIAHAKLIQGEIDLYPEYTGTGLLAVLNLPAVSDPAQVHATVSKAYAEQFNLVWLKASVMNDSQAIAVTPEISEKLGIKTISDFVAHAPNLRMIGPPEFLTRPDGLPGIERVYGKVNLQSYTNVDLDLRYRTVGEGKADALLANSTDGGIAQFRMVVLQDDKGVFPPYNIAPVVRKGVLDMMPGIAAALDPLAPELTDLRMQQMNYNVSGKSQTFARVAQDFLKDRQLLR